MKAVEPESPRAPSTGDGAVKGLSLECKAAPQRKPYRLLLKPTCVLGAGKLGIDLGALARKLPWRRYGVATILRARAADCWCSISWIELWPVLRKYAIMNLWTSKNCWTCSTGLLLTRKN